MSECKQIELQAHRARSLHSPNPSLTPPLHPCTPKRSELQWTKSNTDCALRGTKYDRDYSRKISRRANMV